GEFHADFRALVEGADLQVRIEHHDIADGLDIAGGDDARALLLHDHALGAFALHLDRDVLDVQHDVGDVLANARDRGEFMQHAVDMHRLHRRALQRRQQDAAQRVAQGLTEAALKRLRDQGRKAVRVSARSYLELVRADKFLPIFLDRHCFTHTGQSICRLNHWRWRSRISPRFKFLKPSQAAEPPAIDTSNPPTLART